MEGIAAVLGHHIEIGGTGGVGPGVDGRDFDRLEEVGIVVLVARAVYTVFARSSRSGVSETARSFVLHVNCVGTTAPSTCSVIAPGMLSSLAWPENATVIREFSAAARPFGPYATSAGLGVDTALPVFRKFE